MDDHQARNADEAGVGGRDSASADDVAHPVASSVPHAPPSAPAGWYPDRDDSRRRLYWDGQRWTGDVSTGSVPPSSAVPVGLKIAEPGSALLDATGHTGTKTTRWHRSGLALGVLIVTFVAIHVISQVGNAASAANSSAAAFGNAGSAGSSTGESAPSATSATQTHAAVFDWYITTGRRDLTAIDGDVRSINTNMGAAINEFNQVPNATNHGALNVMMNACNQLSQDATSAQNDPNVPSVILDADWQTALDDEQTASADCAGKLDKTDVGSDFQKADNAMNQFTAAIKGN